MFKLVLLGIAVVVQAKDSDGDGISDKEEKRLIQQFAPRFFLSAAECDVLPAEMERGLPEPAVVARNGTIYAQAFPVRDAVEIHYYHFWANDCGRMGHAWDVEHVSVLVKDRKALYWYAAAHQDTVCDNANAARAADLGAESSGAAVWISRGKHASFLSESICKRGCGGDVCDRMIPMAQGRLINIGERSAPMNGSAWVASKSWPLEKKMSSDFPPALTEALDKGGVQAVYPILIPGQAVILGFNSAVNGLGVADQHTSNALDVAERKTRNALRRARDWVKEKSK